MPKIVKPISLITGSSRPPIVQRDHDGRHRHQERCSRGAITGTIEPRIANSRSSLLGRSRTITSAVPVDAVEVCPPVR